MNTRLDLHELIKSIIGNDNVYFQPPSTIKLKYPCVVYNLNNIQVTNADNIIYKNNKQYSILLIHQDPDNDLVDKFINAGFYFDRFYQADGLNHYSFRKYIK